MSARWSGEIEERILFQDADLLVLDKPSGVSLLADRSGGPCLWDLLREFCRSAGLDASPRQAHRLDKGTSGVLLVALSERAQRSLTRQFTLREVSKSYLAVTAAPPVPPRGLIDLPLCPGRKGRYRVAGPRAEIVLAGNATSPAWRLAPGAAAPSSKKALPSQTYYRILSTRSGRALVLLRPLTGRTHQLRVHLAWLGWPILGDALYAKGTASALSPAAGPCASTSEDSRPSESTGEDTETENRAPALEGASRLLLHCRKVAVWNTWESPGGLRRMAFRAPVPTDFFV